MSLTDREKGVVSTHSHAEVAAISWSVGVLSDGFQLTATRTWLLFEFNQHFIVALVSTHSHVEVAAPYMQKHCAARLC